MGVKKVQKLYLGFMTPIHKCIDTMKKEKEGEGK